MTYFWNKDNFYWDDFIVKNLRDENFIISNFYWDGFIVKNLRDENFIISNFYWDDFIHSLYWVKTLLFDNFYFCGYIVRNLGEWWEICTGAGFTHSLYYFYQYLYALLKIIPIEGLDMHKMQHFPIVSKKMEI